MIILGNVSKLWSIKRDYFPRWDSNFEWKCRNGPIISRYGDDGYCDDESKIIYLSSEIKSQIELKLILIHEICHAITKTGHCTTWENRMFSAACRARDLDDSKLAHEIEREIKYYRKKRAA